MIFRLAALALVPLLAVQAFADVPQAARGADIVFLGEVHDNPAHHRTQAEWVAALEPSALVFEMIRPETAQTVTPELARDSAALEAALGWEESGWPEFDDYYPIFAAAPDARVYGAAVPRAAARQILDAGVASAMETGDIARFGLGTALPADQQAAREALQMAAHCDALPEEMLPGMVLIQRVRDAWLARQALLALDQTGGPVVVITGNGHARIDWGAPAAIRLAAPGVGVFALGQSEGGSGPDGRFDLVADAPPAERPDPCAAFR